MNSPTRARYIASIDGLRAISVLAVIAFHYFSGFENAGYLGVDVFFVISGFVITASIANYETPPSLKAFAIEFYIKRFKRLLPALFVVVIFTSILVMLVTTEGKDNIRTGALSLIGGANIFLYIKEADYFALTSELNPFTHMWSLAVEDQFYLLFPFLLWSCAFFALDKTQANINRLLTVLSIICIGSLTAFTALFDYDYSFSFYMMPTRLWQIGAGIIAYLLVSRSDQFIYLQKIPIILPIIILLSILGFGHYQPLLAHVAVTLITALILGILWFNHSKPNILNFSVPVYIGKISYSLYLWHWPFIVLAKHTVGTSITVVCICLVLTFIFAIASYHLIEQPARHMKLNARSLLEKEKLFQKILTTVIASILILYVGVARYAPKKTNLLTSILNIPEVPDYSRHKCHGKRALRKFDDPLKSCLGDDRTSEKLHKVYLLGDSHANQFVTIINEVLEQTPFQLQFINADNSTQGVRGLISKPNYIPLDFAYMLQDAEAEDIFMLSFHRGRLNKKRDVHISLNQEIQPNEFSTNFTTNLLPILKKLEEKQVKKLFIYDTPMMAYKMAAQSCVIQAKFSNSSLCRVSKTQDTHTRKRQENAYEVFKSKFPKSIFWDPLDIIYGKNTHHEIMDSIGQYQMHDMHHITESLAARLKPELEQKFKKIMSKEN